MLLNRYIDLLLFLKVQEMVDNLNKDAAGTFNFTNSSFLPDQTRMSVNEFVDANVQNISITGTLLLL